MCPWYTDITSIRISRKHLSHLSHSNTSVMVKIQVLSDLHLESPSAYDIFEVEPAAEYLALAGDTGRVKDAGLIAFLRKHLAKFKIIFFVIGNHEPYLSSWAT